MSADLSALEADLIGEIARSDTLAAIEQLRVGALGKKGRVSELMAQLGKMPPDERKAFGAAVNHL
jgi:phenylalanyl-tRNA synthetase alpha chain